MPEELKRLTAELTEDVSQLAANVGSLARRYHRSRWERIAQWVVLLIVIALAVLYVVDSVERRAEFRQDIRDLACLAVKRSPPGVSPTIDDLRAKYNCPPFDPDAAAGPQPSPTTATVTKPGRTATATATATQPASTVRMPGATRRLTVRATQTVTRVRVRTVTRTVTAVVVPPCRLPLPVVCPGG